jgi:hypothetical protein
MKKAYLAVGAALAAMSPFAAVPANAETLRYTINWQSGLSLGEAALQSSKSGSTPAPAPITAEAPSSSEPASKDAASTPPPAPKPPAVPTPAPEGGWNFELTLDAALPGFVIRDEYKSKADSKFCSEEFERTVQRGSTKSSEKSKFDPKRKMVTRETQNGGGKSEMEISECAHDALAFLQFVRDELAQGRLPPHQAVYFGAKYDLQVNYIGNDTVKLGDRRIDADVIRVNSHGPKSDFAVEIFFAKDDMRTPLLARIPLAMGTFTVELMR